VRTYHPPVGTTLLRSFALCGLALRSSLGRRMAHLSSSPASAANLKRLATPTRSSSGTRLHSLPENIEVEKKVEVRSPFEAILC
jgi:hypothetical protein